MPDLKRVLVRIALAEHTKECVAKGNGFTPINECPCYNPAVWASEALGFLPPYERSDRENEKLAALLD